MNRNQKELSAILAPDETVLWSAPSHRPHLRRCPDQAAMYRSWALLAVFAALSLLFYVFHAARNMGASETLFCLFFFNLIPFSNAIFPFTAQNILRRDSLFVITDRRIISVIKGEALALPRDKALRWAVTVWDGDCGNLVFNAAVDRPLQKSREDAVLGVRGPERIVTGLVFYHIQDPASVAALLAA